MDITVPVERVWELLTEAEHLGRWFGDAGAEIELRPGGAMSLSWAEHGTVSARVEQVDPERLFSYRWAASTNSGDVELGEHNSTLVEFTLTREGDGTRLRVVESGFAALDLSADEQARKAEGNDDGWRIKFGDFAEYTQRVAV
jgi:uncharacterized protein YndB with AHSA1/START domain